jgi:hypothetical protein
LRLLSAFFNIFQQVDFPDNEAPTNILPCLVFLLSNNCIIFLICYGLTINFASFNYCSIADTNN